MDTCMRASGVPPSRVIGFDLVIFDCDGVLVDSERLAVRHQGRGYSHRLVGPSPQIPEIVDRFVGRSAGLHAPGGRTGGGAIG